MTTYKAIKGFSIQTIAGDPDNPIAGQVWYNSSTRKLKAAGGGSWASAPALNNGTYQGGGMGSQTAALSTGGKASPTSYNAKTEEYNGSSWSEVEDLPTAISYFGSMGTQTAGLIAAGAPVRRNQSYEYDGTNWSSGGNLNTGRKQGGGFGIQTAALYTGGEKPTVCADTETYDGSSWTEVGDMNTVRNNNRGFGVVDDGVIVGGAAEATQVAEEWNGTSWTATNALNSDRQSMAMAGIGVVSTAGMVVAGYGNGPGGAVATVEEYNGSTWTEIADKLTATIDSHSSRTSTTAAIVAAGEPGFKTISEEWNNPSAVTFTSS
jgi:hypothetical protein